MTARDTTQREIAMAWLDEAGFDVIGHRVVVRVPYQGETIEIEDLSPKARPRKQRAKKEPAIPSTTSVRIYFIIFLLFDS